MDLQDKQGLSYMFITHDLCVVRHISTNIMVMYMGKVVEYAPKEELFLHQAHPYTQALLSAIPTTDLNRRNRKRHALAGEVANPINPAPGCRFAPRCPYACERCKEPQALREVSDVYKRQTQIIALENGDIDAIRSPSISSCLNLNEASGATWASADSAGRVTMYISANSGQPGENADFRKAVQSAVNKEDVVQGATEGYATIIDIDMCPSYSGHPSGYQVVEQDVDCLLYTSRCV